MPEVLASNFLAAQLQKTYRWLRAVTFELSEEQLRRQPNLTTPSIRFHLFHSVRWADDLQRLLTGSKQQIWDAEDVASQWGLDPSSLGINQSGATMDEEVAASLPLPRHELLFSYVDAVLHAADEALQSIDDARLAAEVTIEDGQTRRVDRLVTVQLSHASRHLGAIECLRGVQGLHGTATV